MLGHPRENQQDNYGNRSGGKVVSWAECSGLRRKDKSAADSEF